MKLNKTHNAWRLLALLACGIACLAAVGCGGGDDEGDSGSEVLTKAEYVERGNEICDQAVKKKEAALKKMFAKLRTEKVTTEAEQEKLVETVGLPPVFEMVQELGDLGLPKGEEAKAKKMVKGFEEATREFKSNPRSALTQYAAVLSEPIELAKQLGLKSCELI